MIGLMLVPLSFALLALWLTRGRRLPDQRWFGIFALITLPTPFLANSAGLGVHRDGASTLGRGAQPDR